MYELDIVCINYSDEKEVFTISQEELGLSNFTIRNGIDNDVLKNIIKTLEPDLEIYYVESYKVSLNTEYVLSCIERLEDRITTLENKT